VTITTDQNLAKTGLSAQSRLDLRESVTAKVTKRLFWFLFLLYACAFLDRINIGFAALTMNHDIGLSATQFGLANSIFTVGYIAFQLPSNLILEKAGARIWLALIMITWGVAGSATMFTRGPGDLYVYRFVLGVAEAGFMPGLLLYITYWIPESHRARAVASFSIAMPAVAAVGSVISSLILGMNGIGGLKGWQWLFLLEGLPSIVVGVAIPFYLSDKPAKARWLSPDEKTLLEARLGAEGKRAAQPPGQRSKLGRLWREMTRPTVIGLAIVVACQVATLAVITSWAPQIVKSFHKSFSILDVGLLAAIPPACAVVSMIYWGRRSDKSGERRKYVIGGMLIAAIGWIMTGIVDEPVVRMIGLVLATSGGFTAWIICWTLPPVCLSEEARAAGIAVIGMIAMLGALISPTVFGILKDMTNTYLSGLVFVAVLLVIGAIIMGRLRINVVQRS
jgi:ACS family 4-hydroxyphenylacetate permease-like MFS transporter